MRVIHEGNYQPAHLPSPLRPRRPARPLKGRSHHPRAGPRSPCKHPTETKKNKVNTHTIHNTLSARHTSLIDNTSTIPHQRPLLTLTHNMVGPPSDKQPPFSNQPFVVIMSRPPFNMTTLPVGPAASAISLSTQPEPSMICLSVPTHPASIPTVFPLISTRMEAPYNYYIILSYRFITADNYRTTNVHPPPRHHL